MEGENVSRDLNLAECIGNDNGVLVFGASLPASSFCPVLLIKCVCSSPAVKGTIMR